MPSSARVVKTIIDKAAAVTSTTRDRRCMTPLRLDRLQHRPKTGLRRAARHELRRPLTRQGPIVLKGPLAQCRRNPEKCSPRKCEKSLRELRAATLNPGDVP